MTTASPQTVRLLIAALGGEGGGVLAAWITNAAVTAGHVAQRTSIPGVAQRTGATTYYLEIAPAAAGGAVPVLALNPAPGEVDVMLSSELLETARAVQAGNVTPARTLLIASTHRIYTVDEKSGMADGRFDPARLCEIAERFSRRAILADLAAAARQAGSQLNAVMLGALAASGALPIGDTHFRTAIRAEGKAIDANLRGYEAGMEIVSAAGVAEATAITPAILTVPERGDLLEARAVKLPSPAASVALEGVRRLKDYQNAAYAEWYLTKLETIALHRHATPAVLSELARLLAVRMSFEDTIRVAQLKLREGRIERLRREAGVSDGALIEVAEFMKPGPEEILSLLPPRLARRALAFVARRGWSERSFKLKVRTTGGFGFLRLRLLAGLRSFRPRTLRFAEEREWTGRWLSLVSRALEHGSEPALSVIATAAIVKGYGETMKRGLANWNLIAREVIEPYLSGHYPAASFADAVTQARLAALADPDGKALSALIGSLQSLESQHPLAAA
jgi:indolepyruvate ferredoxin oxidoreductase beta subunit